MRELKIGEKYKLNESLRGLFDMETGMSRPPILAGTECEVIEYAEIAKPYVTILVNGLSVRTEDHMLD